jgi:hypothetical protein
MKHQDAPGELDIPRQTRRCRLSRADLSDVLPGCFALFYAVRRA